MIYTCGCGFKTCSWAEREIHRKSCGKPVEKLLKEGLEKWLN